MIRHSATTGTLNDFEELVKPINKFAVYFNHEA